jgi:predicted double-glycine peptidase
MNKLLEFPELRQVYNFDCGASALQSVLVYYGYNEREDKLLKKLKARNTNIFDNGVYIKDIKKIAESYGLTVSIEKGLEPEELIEYIDKDIPVILLLQAWRDSKSHKNWINDYKDGHYVVLIGYDGFKLIFEDPSSYTRTYLTFRELDSRWHAIDDNGKKDIESVSIIIKGKKKFKVNKLTHMD